MPGRKDEFALGATFKKTPDGELNNAVTETGNNVNEHVQRAVNAHTADPHGVNRALKMGISQDDLDDERRWSRYE